MISYHDSPNGDVHYNDWPNTQGFDCHYEEHTPIELKIHGYIPPYASGVLFRTGIGPRTVDSQGKLAATINHWFDGFSQVHRFQIHAPDSPDDQIRVTYNSRLTSDGLIDRVQETGKLDQFTFAAKYEPCRSFFNKVQAVFQAAPTYAPHEINNAVTMSINFPGLSSTGQAISQQHDKSVIGTLCNKTDATRIQMIDPETLEPIGITDQKILHPDLKGVASGAHAKSDPTTGDVFNYNLDFTGPNSTYRMFKVSVSTGETKILATFRHAPAYLHSFFLTEHYAVLCVWNSHYKAGGASVLWNKNLVDAMMYNDNVPAKWYVIDKRCPETEAGKGIVAVYESEAFFSFHTINAFEEVDDAGNMDIIADLAMYKNMDMLHHLYIDNLLSDSSTAKILAASPRMKDTRSTLRRYKLVKIPQLPPSDPKPSTETTSLPCRIAEVEFEAPLDDSMELPTLNFNHFTKPYRYIYGIINADGQKSTFVDGLIKYDIETHTSTRWEVHGHTPGEAIFIPNPDATDEDDGILLSVVLNGYTGTSYLLALDPKTMSEVGRAEVPGAIGFGFHGLHSKLGLKGERGLEVHY